jgi:hypothetical protein
MTGNDSVAGLVLAYLQCPRFCCAGLAPRQAKLSFRAIYRTRQVKWQIDAKNTIDECVTLTFLCQATAAGRQYRFHIDSIMQRLKSSLAICSPRDRIAMMLLRSYSRLGRRRPGRKRPHPRGGIALFRTCSDVAAPGGLPAFLSNLKCTTRKPC